MYKQLFNRRKTLKFKRFSNKSYALFAVLGREVLVGVLSVATLTYAKASGVSTHTEFADSDSTVVNAQHELREVSVMGTRAPLTQSRQARMVTVLSREEIQSAPVQSVNDVLKLVGGVDVRQKGPLGTLTDVSIRGGSSEQIAVLLNGINMGDAQTAHNVFDLPVDKDDIERIEVLEGPAARVYGTSSLLGAINIVTKGHTPSTSPQRQLSAHLEGGSYGYLQAGARGTLATPRFTNSVSASYTRSDGYLRSASGHLSADYKSGKAFYQGSYADPDVRLSDPSYLGNLAQQDEEQRMRDLKANWNWKAAGDDMIKYDDMEAFFNNPTQVGDGVRRASADVAFTGGDNFVMWFWLGNHIKDLVVMRLDPKTVVSVVQTKLREWGVEECNFTYDMQGIGQYFKGFFKDALPFNNQMAPVAITRDEEDGIKYLYKDLKSQSAWLFYKDVKELKISIDNALLERKFSGNGYSNWTLGRILQKERKAIRRDENGDDRGFRVLSKKIAKRYVGHSPDFIESCYYWEYPAKLAKKKHRKIKGLWMF